MYLHGIVEAMIQTEALRLAMLKVDYEDLTSVDVLNYGFLMIKNLDTGGLTTPLTYGTNDVEGIDQIRVQQVQNGEIVDMGTHPARHVYEH